MLVSIIIPAFNREALIREALASVVAQRHRPVEVVVVDDGSADRTAAVAEDYAKEAVEAGVELRVLRGSNRGSTAARNTGIAAARGDALLFLDSDDVLAPDGLSELVTALAAEDALDFVYGKVLIGDEHLQATGDLVGQSAEDLLEDPVTYHWHTMGALYRSALVAASGGWDQTADGSDDWVFQSRIKFAARTAQYVDTEVGLWRQHADERLGATSFRESYTVDVTKACAAIHRQWSEAGRLKPRCRRRLYFRALRHCWELGCYGSREPRDEALLRVRQIGEGALSLGVITAMVAAWPVSCDRVLYKWINGRRPTPVMRES